MEEADFSDSDSVDWYDLDINEAGAIVEDWQEVDRLSTEAHLPLTDEPLLAVPSQDWREGSRLSTEVYLVQPGRPQPAVPSQEWRDGSRQSIEAYLPQTETAVEADTPSSYICSHLPKKKPQSPTATRQPASKSKQCQNHALLRNRSCDANLNGQRTTRTKQARSQAQRSHSAGPLHRSPRGVAAVVSKPERITERRVRVAIVGAGPVGLWIAVLLAREHAVLRETTKGKQVRRRQLAPIINVFEQRTEATGYGKRRIVLAITQPTQELLNKHLLTGRDTSSHSFWPAKHIFAPTCPISKLECVLRTEFQVYTSRGFGSITLGKQLETPDDLLENHDVVVIATGRGFPATAWRKAMGMQMRVGRSEAVLVLGFLLKPSAMFSVVYQDFHTAAGRLDFGDHLQLFLRQGLTQQEGWLWIVGLGSRTLTRISSRLQSKGDTVYTSFRSMWATLTGEAVRRSVSCSPRRVKYSPATNDVKALFVSLDTNIDPAEVSPRVIEASYWHSDNVVRRVQQPDGTNGWIVLAGDTACGKPFLQGTTLNAHFHDALALCEAPWTSWKTAARKAAKVENSTPFNQYQTQYKAHISGFGFAR